MDNEIKESGNINPKTFWDKLKSLPRIVFMFLCAYLLHYVITNEVQEYKVETIGWLCFGLFVARGTEKAIDMFTARK